MKSHYQHRWYEGSYTFEKSRKRWKWAGRYRTEDGEARKILAGQSGVDDRIPLELRVKEWLKKIDYKGYFQHFYSLNLEQFVIECT